MIKKDKRIWSGILYLLSHKPLFIICLLILIVGIIITDLYYQALDTMTLLMWLVLYPVFILPLFKR